MSIKWKTVVGIALLETFFLAILIWQAVNYLTVSNQQALSKRAGDTVNLIESVVKDAVISMDLATLEEVAGQVVQLEEVVYVQITDDSGYLAAAGNLPESTFSADSDFQSVDDGVYDTRTSIVESGYSFGQIELGISVDSLNALVAEARQRFLVIAGLELVLVALCSWLLATLLTRRITQLRKAAEAAQKGQWLRLSSAGKGDELGQTMQAFDQMSHALSEREQRLKDTIASLEEKNQRLDDQRKEMQLLQRQTQQAQELRSSIVDSSLDALLSIDSEGRIIEYSKSAVEMLGWTREEAMGRDMATMLIPEQYRSAHAAGMQKFLETGEGPLIGKRIEAVALHRRGHQFPIELALMATYLENDVVVTATLRDITERKASEAALIEAKSTAEEASLAKSRFLSHMSHEIRSPLNAVLGALEVLGQGQDLSPDMQKMIGIARGSGNALLHVINDVLDFSRIEAGQIEVREEIFSLGPIVREVFAAIMTRPGKPDLTLAFLADAFSPLRVCADPDRVRQVLTILVDNAFKFTQSGSITVAPRQIEVDGETMWQVDVHDTGPGIPESMIDAVFGEFEQVDAARDTGYGGTGLGLTIARQLVQLMGGSVSVVSTEGEGSCFSFTVKAAQPEGKQKNELAAPAQRAVDVAMVVSDRGLAFALAEWAEHTGLNVVANTDGVNHQMSWLSQSSVADERILLVDTPSLAELPVPEVGDWRILKLGEASDERNVESLGGGTLFAENLGAAIFEPASQPSARRARSDEGLHMAAAPPEQPLSPDEAEHRLLLVDDVEANRLVAAAVLQRHGYRLDHAEDGEQAVAMAGKQPYHAIFMDVRMPKMNGLQATEIIRKGHGPNARTKIIALTANAETSEIDRCREAGMDDFVSKPFQVPTLISAVAQRRQNNEDTTMTSTEAFENEEVLNEPALAQLATDTSWETIPMMLSIFIREIKNRWSAVEAAFAEGDIGELREQAHALKSCSGTYGGARLSAVAKSLEYAAAEHQTDLLAGLVATLATVAEETEKAYSQKMTALEEKIASE